MEKGDKKVSKSGAVGKHAASKPNIKSTIKTSNAEINTEKIQLKREEKNINNHSNKANESDLKTSENETFLQINVKELGEVLLEDKSEAIKNSVDKWPLIIDETQVTATFLRHRDANCINCLDRREMSPNDFRLAFLRSIRYDKPFVLDLMQLDKVMLEAVRAVCDQIDEHMFEQICNKQILENQNYMRLVRLPADGDEFEAHFFARMDNFKVIFLTSNPCPCQELLKLTMPIKVAASGRDSQ
jgi:hypothetical protein